MSVQEKSPSIEHTDVLIVGSGISGIGAAYYLQKEHPAKSYVILEGRETSGGTWDLFRYPGIRSDSDLHTFGYEFKPWLNDQSIASADAIRAYIRETADENGINQHIRFQHKVVEAAWSSEKACWMVCIERLDTGVQMRMSCNWLFSAAGYYRYDRGFTPRFEGVERFKGQVVHPQHWPENLKYNGKRILVIGSGATAVTIVPAMTNLAAHVTMLQRTPSYILSQPSIDPIAKAMRTLLPEKWAYSLTRSKNITRSRKVWLLCLKYPKAARGLIRWLTKRELPKGYPVDEHFNPPYNPWEQRLCVVPDGDLFKAISIGKASIVTDHIDTFTEDGVRLKSGKELVADIVVTATGLNVQLFGGIRLLVDDVPVELSTKVAFKGMMLDGVPNFAFSLGYTNSSWTLKVGLTCEHFCRILRHMDHHGQAICYPELPDPHMPTRPLLDFGAGYVKRVIDTVPRQGADAPWLMSMDYREDVRTLREGPVEDLHLKFLPQSSKVHSCAPIAHRRTEA